MSALTRDSKPAPGSRRAGLVAATLLSGAGLLALLVDIPLSRGALIAVSTLLPSALILVGAPRPGRPWWGALLAALLLGAAMLSAGLLIATGARSLALLFAGLGLAPLILTLWVFTLRFEREQQPTEDELESLRRLGEEP